MARGRPAKCPWCGSHRTIGKGYRKTATLGLRALRKCKDCGRKFTRRQPAQRSVSGRHKPE